MIAVVALLLVAPAVATPVRENEIVIARRKLETWRGSARVRKGQYSCTTVQSSGDMSLDHIACEALTGCMKQLQPKVDGLLASHPTKVRREQTLAAVNADLMHCTTTAREEKLRQLDALGGTQ